MEELPFEKGIFIHSENLESKFMVESLKALLKVCPTAKITSVDCDERIDGFKVCFGDSDAISVLEKKFLMVGDQRISVYPLGTYLLIHGVHTRGNDDVERELTTTIQEKFGKVLHFQRMPDLSVDKSKDCYLVLVDIPELTRLSVFGRNGYPRMSVEVSSMYKTFKVTFWCRHCKNSDHSLQECVERSQNVQPKDKNSETASCRPQHIREDESRGSSSNSVDGVDKIHSEIRMEATRDFQPEPINLFAKKVGSEEVMKYGQFSEHSAEQPFRGNELREQPESTEEQLQNDSVYPADATSTTDADEEIQMDGNQSPHQNREASSAASTYYSVGIKQEPLDNPDEIPKITIQAVYSTQGRRQPSTAGSSHRQMTGCLSERLQSCINGAFDAYGILSREYLDAFLVHVKKKSNPRTVAGNFTKNVDGLKSQLQKILDLYYSEPDTGTKDDIQFIKWLIGLVKRFDGTVPKKRKSSGRSGTQAKKK